jgi:hypothetical protein
VTAADLLQRARDLGFHLEPRDSCCLAVRPASKLPPDLVADLRRHRSEILCLLTPSRGWGAVIHNSDYPSADACKHAIDRHFEERNEHFRQHPRKAGNKIWGKERVAPEFNPANNCKDPRW